MNAQLKPDPASLIAAGRRAIEIEGRALTSLIPRLDHGFAQACEICLQCKGRVIVTGMGKSGHIAGKIAATLASTGTPSFFMHAAEASHGDIGMITREDVLLALSNSGETDEVLLLIPHVSRLGVPLIAVTGNPKSSLARAARVHLDVSVAEEACPAQPGAHRQHHGDAGAGRRARGGDARGARFHARRFRALASRRHARPQAAAARLRRHAHRRRAAAS
jgi:D-arabinose 5-phosphate isomerase GutQ